MLKSGKCIKEYPAYTWRDYTALVYLSDDFEGGEFIFTDANKNVQVCKKILLYKQSQEHK